MQVILTEQDIKKIEDMIKVTPFEFAYPLFQFFRNKANEAQKLEESRKSLEKASKEQNKYTKNEPISY